MISTYTGHCIGEKTFHHSRTPFKQLRGLTLRFMVSSYCFVYSMFSAFCKEGNFSYVEKLNFRRRLNQLISVILKLRISFSFRQKGEIKFRKWTKMSNGKVTCNETHIHSCRRFPRDSLSYFLILDKVVLKSMQIFFYYSRIIFNISKYFSSILPFFYV